MNKRIRARLLITLFLSALSIYLFAGFPPSVPNMRDRIHRGLDLQGGIHLVLQVVTDDAIRAETDQAIETTRTLFQKQNIAFRQLTRQGNDRFVAVGIDPAKDAHFREALTNALPDWDLGSAEGSEPNTYGITLKPNRVAALRNQTVDQAINTIRNRIDQIGVTEPIIQRHGGPGSYEILVQLPGEGDASRVKGLMQSTALLELKLVDSGPFPNEAEAKANYGGAIPADLELLPSKDRGTSSDLYYVTQRVAPVTGRDLKSAYPSRDTNGHPAVSFSLTADGSQRFARVTEPNIGKRLAIVLDGKVQSAPAIHMRVSDSGIIEGGPGGFAPQEAQDLALILRSGALPASIKYLEEEVVGPTLGADSIRAGVRAAVVALIAVVAFMLCYYRMSGINATIAMILNIVILLGAIAYFGITLTLPGIAWHCRSDIDNWCRD